MYKLLRERDSSLESLNLSGNKINEEGLNLLLKGKTKDGGHPLFLGLIVNEMEDRNSLINNIKVTGLHRVEASGSTPPMLDLAAPVKAFEVWGVEGNKLHTLDASRIRFSA